MIKKYLLIFILGWLSQVEVERVPQEVSFGIETEQTNVLIVAAI